MKSLSSTQDGLNPPFFNVQLYMMHADKGNDSDNVPR